MVLKPIKLFYLQDQMIGQCLLLNSDYGAVFSVENSNVEKKKMKLA